MQKSSYGVITAIIIIVLIVGAYFNYSSSDSTENGDESIENLVPDNLSSNNSLSESDTVSESDTISESDTYSTKSAYTFRNENLLNQHYEKHGIDMGFSNAKEYEAAACKVILNPNSLHKKESEDNDDVYYLEETNEFVIVSVDGYIRTYFKPDRGIDYYNRQ